MCFEKQPTLYMKLVVQFGGGILRRILMQTLRVYENTYIQQKSKTRVQINRVNKMNETSEMHMNQIPAGSK